jgi:hypothetical protein
MSSLYIDVTKKLPSLDGGLVDAKGIIQLTILGAYCVLIDEAGPHIALWLNNGTWLSKDAKNKVNVTHWLPTTEAELSNRMH